MQLSFGTLSWRRRFYLFIFLSPAVCAGVSMYACLTLEINSTDLVLVALHTPRTATFPKLTPVQVGDWFSLMSGPASAGQGLGTGSLAAESSGAGPLSTGPRLPRPAEKPNRVASDQLNRPQRIPVGSRCNAPLSSSPARSS
jgi:hypothetical protein